MNQKTLDIQREISKIENIYPDNNLIITYKDFLKHREFLHNYQYNCNVFCSIINITNELWDSAKRISRQSLLQVAKRYIKKSNTRDDIPPKTASQIFELFKQIVVHENIDLSRETVNELKKTINSIMIRVKLKNDELQWLCDHSTHSKFILNRLLRYHLKSKVISNWANNNFEKDFVRSRRSEITSWIIDENPTFKIDRETLEYDFEFQNECDKKRWNDFIDDYSAYKAVEKELSPLLMTEANNIEDERGVVIGARLLTKPEYTQLRRIYSISLSSDISVGSWKPNFEKTAQSFYSEFDNYYNRIMAWSIAYSRIEIKEKIKQISNYYHDSVCSTFFNIGVKLKSVEYFEWLKFISNEKL